VNLSPLLDAVAVLAGAVITACVPIVTLKVTGWLGLKVTAAQEEALNGTIQTALDQALQYGQQVGDSALANVTIKNAALASAVAFVLTNAPAAIAHFGLSDADIADRVAGALAKLLHETNTAPPPDPAKAASEVERLNRAMGPTPFIIKGAGP
jgi:hypothetical protein